MEYLICDKFVFLSVAAVTLDLPPVMLSDDSKAYMCDTPQTLEFLTGGVVYSSSWPVSGATIQAFNIVNGEFSGKLNNNA